MKRILTILTCLALAGAMLACSTTIPNEFSVPWTAVSIPSEYTEYNVEFREYSNDATVVGTLLASGTQSTYLHRYEGTDYPDCVTMTTTRTVTYLDVAQNVVYGKDGTTVLSDRRGKTDVQTDTVIFSIASGTLMRTRFVRSSRVYESDPSLNYACEATYGGGLRVKQFVQDNDPESATFGEILTNDDGSQKVKGKYSFKAKHVPSTTYDNAQLMLVTRYAANLKESWNGSFTVVSLADICYTGGGKLYSSTFSIKAAATRSTPGVPATFDDTAFSETLAQSNTAGDKYIPCLHMTFSRTGSMATSQGPQFFADYAAARQVTEGAELANVLVRYEQFVPYLNLSNNGAYQYVNSLTLTYAARTPR